jgi:hypothetical protein
MAAMACSAGGDGSELGSGSGSGGGGADGRHYPEPNGVHISETEACQVIGDALRGRALSLGCSKTVRTCPGLLRTQYDPDCMEYDQGTVYGCVDYFQSQSACEGLVETDCVLTGFPGTEPAGCP